MAFQPSDKPYAFISVYDKTGLEPVARALVEKYGYELLSTGGTKKFLEERGIPVVESSEITGFGELLGGRVKSLHPEIFAAILAKRNDPTHKVNFKIDTVIVNLYPFEQELNSPKAKEDEAYLLEYIDIGGSSLIRAAAKNHPSVNVLCQPSQYEGFLKELKLGGGETSAPFRKQLASEAFSRSATYDGAISKYFTGLVGSPESKDVPAGAELPESISLNLQKIADLRYGENPHQNAALYGLNRNTVDFEQLQGKELSYNNILDMEAAWGIVTEFNNAPCCAVIKHNNPCGVAMGRTAAEAYQTAFGADPLSAFGGIVALNCPVTADAATQMKEVFLEVIIAPAFEPDALELLSAKKNLRLVKRPMPVGDREPKPEYRQVSEDLFLVQVADPSRVKLVDQLIQNEQIEIVTANRPTQEQLQDMVFAWKVVKHVKSNGIVLAKGGRTVGMGVGQTSRIGALENAIRQACDEAKDAVLASDGFLPAVDNIHAAVQARVGAIIQPGGSIRDKDVIELANQHNLPMVTTGIREFKH